MNNVFADKKITEIIKKITAEFKPEKIILFGSWAWGKPEPDSDVDMLIVKKSSKPRAEREYELRSLLFPPEIPLDIIVYTPEELKQKIENDRNLFLKDIVNNGLTLYDNNKICN